MLSEPYSLGDSKCTIKRGVICWNGCKDTGDWKKLEQCSFAKLRQNLVLLNKEYIKITVNIFVVMNYSAFRHMFILSILVGHLSTLGGICRGMGTE